MSPCPNEHQGPDAFAGIWRHCKENPDPEIISDLRKRNWRPDDPSERALFFFLANDLAAYHDIDFDHACLRFWHESGSEALREAIRAGIRKSGDARLLAVFKTDRGGRRNSLHEKDVDVQIEILLKNKKYAEAFGLLSQADYPQGLRIISGLRKEGWKNTAPMGRQLQERLEAVLEDAAPGNRLPSSHAMSIFQDFRPMFLGREAAPPDEKTLLSWIEDRDDFRHRSAAVVTWAERGFGGLPDVANRLCTDPYWQVRMAAAGAELLKPGSLTPANRDLLEQDPVYWVQALLKTPASGRLADLGPGALEALEKAETRSNPKNRPAGPDDFFGVIRRKMPGAVREYILILGEYLSTDGVWREDNAHDAGDAGVEIESDQVTR